MSELRRVVGTPGAIVIGLGSILGTGMFVALALAASEAGVWAIGAVVVAGFVATCSGLSSARLAAAHPVSGGTYAYATRLLTPISGFAAGWLFLLAKSASAATAAVGVVAYVLAGADVAGGPAVPAAAAAVALGLTGLVLAGVRRTSLANTVLVSVTLLGLVVGGGAMLMVAAGDPSRTADHLSGLASVPDGPGLLHASALAFVAFTGFGRVATLGEEIRDPARTIPRAVVATLAVSGSLALLVIVAGVAAIGADAFGGAAIEDGARRAAVLERVVMDLVEADRLAAGPGGLVRWLLVAGAVTAMLGVLLNLILGLSRVAMAMGRDRVLPAPLGRVSAGGEPVIAVLAIGLVVAALAAIGDVRVTWTFSAVTVLLYYALTNLSALRLPRPSSMVQRLAPWGGLAGCVGLAAAVPAGAWVTATIAFAVGLVIRAVCRPSRATTTD